MTEHHASDDYEARLERTDDSPLKAAARWTAAVASAVIGDAEFEPSGTSVVVYSRSDESRVLTLRTSNLEEAERLIELVRRDLEELTPEDFMAEWGQADEPQRT